MQISLNHWDEFSWYLLSTSSGTYPNKVYLWGSQILFCHSLLQKLFKEYDSITVLLKQKMKWVLLKFHQRLLLASRILRIVFLSRFTLNSEIFLNGKSNLQKKISTFSLVTALHYIFFCSIFNIIALSGHCFHSSAFFLSFFFFFL